MNFTPIAPENIHGSWPVVRAGLERIKEVGGERWLPEDVFTHIRIKRAQLVLGYDDEVYRGFFITENKLDPFTNRPYLWVWCLFAEPAEGQQHFAAVRAFMGETMAYIDGMARAIGARGKGAIQFDGRFGWQKYLADYFAPAKVRFEREL